MLPLIFLFGSMVAGSADGADSGPGFFGARLTGVMVEIDGTSRNGVRIDSLLPGGGAAAAGLIVGDVVLALNGGAFEDGSDPARAALEAAIRGRRPGDRLSLTVTREVVTLEGLGEPLGEEERARLLADPDRAARAAGEGHSRDLRLSCERRFFDVEVVLGVHPSYRGSPVPSLEWKPTSTQFGPARELEAWLEEYGIAHDSADLRARLAAIEERGDPARSPSIVAAHRYPFALPEVVSHVVGLDELPSQRPLGDLGAWFLASAARADGGATTPSRRSASPKGTVDEILDTLASILDRAVEQRDAAIASLTAQDVDFIDAHWHGLTGRLLEDIYLYNDEDTERLAANRRILELGCRVDRRLLRECAGELLGVVAEIESWKESLLAAVRAENGDTTRPIIAERVTPHGRIIISGTGDTWHRETDVALLIDLGGDDFYGNGAGSTVEELRDPRRSVRPLPISLVIDCAGNDAYESTHDGAQGFGLLGVGVLVDVAGDDTYLGQRWAQGAGFLGLGILIDDGGSDRYRSEGLSQGTALFGAAALLDASGDDRYDLALYGQGLGLPGGLGAIVDRSGDDEYFAKGRRPTGYGDEGIFDAWAQGCGLGLRLDASGGLGLLIDGDGRDRYEAGNFAQGGGYYFGFGALLDRGTEDDRYIGSRYNQGFPAHQAAGFFCEQGGND
ncbi:MAG: PDZ domain-containing protein, partial [Planctomycetes bacterium]|nr:PDZ domain-containing protein [Planctomycetota bacterium]